MRSCPQPAEGGREACGLIDSAVQLSLHADYALRVLIYLGSHPGEVVPTRRISDAYGISKHHLVRVVQTLGEHGYVEMLPGRSGGVRLVRDPDTIALGDVVRVAEPNMRLVECFDRDTNTCPIIDDCGLKSYLHRALQAFIASLNEHTLGELLRGGRRAALAGVFVTLQATPRPSPGRTARR
jgi:Rrf2 family nitric oxide-sensitive transcriptional repressor